MDEQVHAAIKQPGRPHSLTRQAFHALFHLIGLWDLLP